ncbi:MAG: hypothetical protein D6722_17920 [Bacteroidetes bacterium]|nr:MAG: hypothetical protein D6722_17920 [Bacteroidota bacterium]
MRGQAPETPYFFNRGSSFHVGAGLVHYLASYNYEAYRHSADMKHHWGLGAGLSAGWGYFGAGLGGHIMGNYWSGRGKNHFEARLGVAPTYFTGNDYGEKGFFPVPIVLVGYRRQAPGSSRFFFVNVGSVGVGVGVGTAFDKKGD